MAPGPRGVGPTSAGGRHVVGAIGGTDVLGRVFLPFATPKVSGMGVVRLGVVRITLGAIAITGTVRGPATVVALDDEGVVFGTSTGTGKGRRRLASRRPGLGFTPTAALVVAIGAAVRLTDLSGPVDASAGAT